MIVESGYPNVGGFKYWCSMLIHIDDEGAMEGKEWRALIATDV